MLLYKLSLIGVKGNFYSAISAMFNNPKSRIQLNEYSTEYFDCPIGVKQGDCISATLFAIFINDLAQEIKDSSIGINLNENLDENVQEVSEDLLCVNILLYADDIVLLAGNENDLQLLLIIVENWCRKWRLEVNLTKTNIMHIRNKRKQQSNFMFLFNFRPVDYCTYYKYLGTTINQYLDYNYTAETLSDSAGRALSSILTKSIKNGGFPYITFSTLIETCVSSISQYGSEVWGAHRYDSTMKIHLRAARFYLGLPKNAPIPAILADIDWLEPVYATKIKMVRQYHRTVKMNNTRLTKAILLWDHAFSRKHENISTWSIEIKDIFHNFELGYFAENIELFPIKETIKSLKCKMKLQQMSELRNKCIQMPQLRTYIKFKDFDSKPSFLSKPLGYIQRKMLAKLSVSCLELRICTGRYTRLPENERICQVSDTCSAQSLVESECHFLQICPAYHDLRQAWFRKMNLPDNYDALPVEQQLSLLLNESGNV